ncbi:MAG TPA: FtsQ-type POTRA domain-containing protein [Nocardioidaceae bacterium]|nr:FtsQ-type POTRA domain-containing protein [Nocardioidaceae bacterium]
MLDTRFPRPMLPRLSKSVSDAGAESATAAEKTIRRARKKFARRQRARRWLAWRRILAIVLVAAAAAGSVWLMLFSSVLAVADVSVDGNEVLDPQQVRRAAAVPTGEPLATVDLDAIAARIEALPPVKSVDVSRAWPDRVRIAIRERDAVAVLERDGAVRGVDDEGVLFRSYPSVPNGLPVVRMGAGTESDALAEATTVVGVLPRNLATMVDFVEVDTIDTISLRLRSGPTIFWGSADDSANKAKVIAVLLKQEASTYDVSVPAQPTIRR